MPTIYRCSTVLAESGFSRSSLYEAIADGTFTRPVKISERAVGWPADEVHALNSARIGGAGPDKLRTLVQRLHDARAELARIAA
jgi:prophage regulatory protein